MTTEDKGPIFSLVRVQSEKDDCVAGVKQLRYYNMDTKDTKTFLYTKRHACDCH